MQVSLSPWHDSLGQLAQQHQAHEAGDQDAVAKALQAQNQEIAGNNAGEGKFPELQAATLERVQRRMACS